MTLETDLDTDVRQQLPSVVASLNYLKPAAETPVFYPKPLVPPPGIPRHSGEVDVQIVPIHNVRPISHQLDLDQHGFRLLDSKTAVSDLSDDEEVRSVYDREMEELISSVTGAQRVLVFDHVIRRSAARQTAKSAVPDTFLRDNKTPFLHVHGDFTPKSAPQRVRDLMGDEADALLQNRVIAVNVWRPLEPVRQLPLALCNARTVHPRDLVPCTVMHRDRRSEIYNLTFNHSHRWFYAPAMNRDEAWIFKTFDSNECSMARTVPHSAFEDPTSELGATPRESIEIRAFGFYCN